jgi:uncharacterized membrane protein YdjX (TVP38/TMEM64 family)
MRTNGSHWRRAALIGGIVGGVIVARTFGPAACLRLENLSRLTETIEGYGALGPALYIAAYVLGVVFFVPGLPMTLLGGRAFGPVRGATYVWIAAITAWARTTRARSSSSVRLPPRVGSTCSWPSVATGRF